MRNLTLWLARLPISIVGANSIMLGTLLNAAEYDDWITWGHEASVVMLIPILLWVICAATLQVRPKDS